jgi:hypothetical protein
MHVGRNLSYEGDGGSSWRKVTVTLDWSDFLALVDEKRVEGYHLELRDDQEFVRSGVQVVNDAGEPIPVRLAYFVMQAQCDILAWTQLVTEGGASARFASSKIHEAYARARILSRSS